MYITYYTNITIFYFSEFIVNKRRLFIGFSLAILFITFSGYRPRVKSRILVYLDQLSRGRPSSFRHLPLLHVLLRQHLTLTPRHLNSPGLNELRQYRRAIGGSSVEVVSPDILNRVQENGSSPFTYQVEVQPGEGGSLRIRLDELRSVSGNHSSGGSSFSISRVPGERCWIEDHANGSYGGGCPPSRHAGCLDITIRRQSALYALYRRPANPARLVVWNYTMCLDSQAPLDSYASFQTLEPATWTPSNHTTTRITHHYGVPVSLLNSTQICQSLPLVFDHVSMLGASHTRYNFDYLLTRCFNSTELNSLRRKHDSFSVGSVDFKLTMFSGNFRQNLREEFQDFRITDSSLFLLQMGAHDLNSYTYASVMGVRMVHFVNEVAELCKRNVTVVVLATPPFPDHDRSMARRHMRNNQAIAAFNRKLADHIKVLQVRI